MNLTDLTESREVLFWMQVRSSLHGCWEWTGFRNQKGYGQITFSNSGGHRPYGAHRISWILHYGNIPLGKLVLHKCDNASCVRPDHLEVGTQSKNIQDAWNRGRMIGNHIGVQGSKNHLAKLSDDDVLEIRRLLSNGMLGIEIARRLNTSPSTVSLIKLGKIWRHLK